MGSMARGCRLCVLGRKSVLFVTGICAGRCFYCPLSDSRHQKDVMYINERKTKRVSHVIEECRLCSSTGVGITGGDPLLRLGRTVRMIRALKSEFGKSFHIHLYAPLYLVSKKSMGALANAGLDELRLHPDIADKSLWHRISSAQDYPWKLGVEIPAVPGMGTWTGRLLQYLSGKIDFLNINELETSDTNACRLTELGFMTKGRYSYAVRGSMQTGRRLLVHWKGRAHLCTSRLKDSVQLKNRLCARAKNVSGPYDLVTPDGTLLRAAVFGNAGTAQRVLRQSLPDSHIRVLRGKVLFPAEAAKALADRLREHGLRPAIVEDYPTYDCMNVMTSFL